MTFFVSCQLVEEEKVEAERNLWFENNVKELDQLIIQSDKNLSDSLRVWLNEKERVLQGIYSPSTYIDEEIIDNNILACILIEDAL